MATSGLQAITRDTGEPAFLRVEKSVLGYRWVNRLPPADGNIALAVAQTHGIPEYLARILVARGSTLESASVDLDPTLKNLMPDPSALADMDRATERFVKAIADREPIAIFGDYDVDGATSASLVLRFLRALGHDAVIYIPDRQLEGYGPNVTAFEQLIADGAKLIVTVDCGTASHEPIALANSLGTDVIVLDHHQADDRLPPAYALVNPNRQDDMSGQNQLAAVGVVFLFLVSVARALRETDAAHQTGNEFDLMQTLDLVALGTVCDVVPLTGLNRAYVRRGLEIMHMRNNAGLRALCDAAGLTSAPNPYHLGFVLGPRLNAGGRIGTSSMATQLLTCDDDLAAAEIAQKLDMLNADRQAMQRHLQDEALMQADAGIETKPGAAVAVAHGEGWHKGLVGLAASRLAEHFRRPSLVIAWDGTGNGSGSARSIQGVDLGAAIREAATRELLLKGGGHAMAAGFTLSRDRLDEFLSFMEQALGESVALASKSPSRRFDGALMAASVNLDFWRELEKAGPYGAGNPQPRFAFAAHRCRYPKVVGEKHVRCTVAASDGSRLDAIAFNNAETPLGHILLDAVGAQLHISGHLRRSDWGGREKIELHIDDAAIPA